jgi:rhodanese-related sulfurtransferase
MGGGWRPLTAASALFVAVLAARAGVAADVERIDVAQLEAMMRAGVPVVDIRRSDEWRATGVVAGSMLITAFDGAGRLDPEFVNTVRGRVGEGKPVALICRSGNRSATAARLLTDGGASATVYDVAGGVRDWAAAGRPLTPCPEC